MKKYFLLLAGFISISFLHTVYGAGLCEAGFVDLSHADLRDENFSAANMRKANLSHADLRGAILRYADLRDVNLSNADLRDADLEGARVNENTKISLPDKYYIEGGRVIKIKATSAS